MKREMAVPVRRAGGPARPERWPLVLFALLAALCLLFGLTASPRLYPVDHGQYEIMMRQCGLTWTAADIEAGDLQYGRPLTEFAYTRFPWMNLLSPMAGNSLVYPVALVRLFTEPFGLNLPVGALALALGAVLAFSTGLLSQALRRLTPRAWAAPGVLLCALYTDRNFAAALRGLYPQGAAMAFTLLYAAVALWVWSLPRKRRARWLPAAWLCSIVMLKSMTPMAVFLPMVLSADAALALSCRRALKRPALTLVAGLLILLPGLSSALRMAAADADYFSNAAVYESAFNTMLPAAEQPSMLLSELGLDDSYLPDVGRSYYEDESAYVHNPRDEEQAEAMFATLTPRAVMGVYLRHPDLLVKVLRQLPVSLRDGFENERNRTLTVNASGFAATRAAGGPLSWLWKVVPLSATGFMLLSFLAGLAFAALAFIRRKLRYGVGFAFAMGCVAFLPLCVMLNGYAECGEYGAIQAFLAVAWLALALTVALEATPQLRQWLTRFENEPYTFGKIERTAGAGSGVPTRATRALLHAAGDRRRLLLVMSVAAVVILVMTFLPAGHPCAVNNGDYGRMMAQMDLTWTGDMFYNTTIQAGHYAIEEYEWVEPFDPLKLTPLKPTYSLYLFSSIVRLLREPFGLPFSTLLLAWVMGAITALCAIVMVNDLYPLLGRWTALAALLLCAILMSETYLTWYNSLYGEGCILAGLVMTLTCALHLCLMPRERSWKRLAWLIGLGISLNVMLTAKAQMLTAVPGAIILFIALAFYQRPYRYDLQALQAVLAVAFCAALAFSGLMVYQSDRTSDSVSQKHTMWQAYFYGIFMISDDPIGDMEALGVDTAMAPDIGKFVQFDDDSRYVYAPLSEEAQTAFYDHVNTFTIIKWYLAHPAKLWQMLDYASGESRELYTGFRVYAGQDYTRQDHDDVNGRNLWPAWRASLTPGHFIGYVLYYGALLVLLLKKLLRRDGDARGKALCAVVLFLLITAALQFPLSVLGNGFADNQKQLFCFALCQDFLLAGTLVVGLRWLYGRTRSKTKGKARDGKGNAGIRHAA